MKKSFEMDFYEFQFRSLAVLSSLLAVILMFWTVKEIHFVSTKTASNETCRLLTTIKNRNLFRVNAKLTNIRLDKADSLKTSLLQTRLTDFNVF
jgi:hypothetical protein